LGSWRFFFNEDGLIVFFLDEWGGGEGRGVRGLGGLMGGLMGGCLLVVSRTRSLNSCFWGFLNVDGHYFPLLCILLVSYDFHIF